MCKIVLQQHQQQHFSGAPRNFLTLIVVATALQNSVATTTTSTLLSSIPTVIDYGLDEVVSADRQIYLKKWHGLVKVS